MISCISVDNMRQSDTYTIANFVPSLELMHRAAYGVFLAGEWKPPVAIVVGSGNNGGDGFALACILKAHNIDCTVFTLSSRLSADSAYYAENASNLDVHILPFASGCLENYETVVDCLLGTGFQGNIRENYRNAINAINDHNAYTISVDINSGMNGDSGNCDVAVKSDLTVTIGFLKNGLITENAGKYMKKLVCADIGIILKKEENYICTLEEWRSTAGRTGYFLCPDWLDMDIIKAFS